MSINSGIFKAYDIRGIYPTELNESAVYAIAQAYCKFFSPKKVVLGRDVRLSGPSLFASLAKGFTDHGVDVVDIGVITTDMLYFATAAYDFDGGIIVSASHNPREYNGLKLMLAGAVAVSNETGITEIREIAQSGYAYKAPTPGRISTRSIRAEYLAKCLSLVDLEEMAPLRVVVNGMFGPVVQNIEALGLPLELVKLNALPDGSFPKGSPDPLLPENRVETEAMTRSSHVAFGAAWDGDADRFFLFDDTGRFVPGYFVTAFLGAYFSKRSPGARIIYEPRLTWATEESVRAAGGVPLINRVGHSFIKARMRAEDAIFGGENSGHFYFRDFYYADNGLIPFLLLLEIISKTGKKSSELFEPYFKKYAPSDELNVPLASVKQAEQILKKIEFHFPDAVTEHIDGLSIGYTKWRANIRASNTQPLLRVNIEARTPDILAQKTTELMKLIEG